MKLMKPILKKTKQNSPNSNKGQQPGIGLRKSCCYVNYSFLFILLIKFEFRVQRALT